MDKRALKILLDAFWSPAGWKPAASRGPSAENFEYAKSKGMMFEPQELVQLYNRTLPRSSSQTKPSAMSLLRYLASVAFAEHTNIQASVIRLFQSKREASQTGALLICHTQPAGGKAKLALTSSSCVSTLHMSFEMGPNPTVEGKRRDEAASRPSLPRTQFRRCAEAPRNKNCSNAVLSSTGL